MIDEGRHNILGVRVNAVDYEAAVAKIIDAAHQGMPCATTALAVHGVMTGALDREHQFRLNQFDLIVPDGQPVRWALKWLHGIRLVDRVYGPNLMLQVCRRAEAESLPVYFFGGSEELLQDLRRKLLAKFPDLCIAGMQASLFRRMNSQERDETVARIRDSGARLGFVGLGCPRQEVWAYEYRDRLSMPLLAVGAAFNFHAGRLAQAPPALQRMGLEWAYRLAMEPRRLWRRYLLLNPLYLSMIAAQWCGLRRYLPEQGKPPSEELLFG